MSGSNLYSGTGESSLPSSSFGAQGERITHGEIDYGHKAVNQERLEGRIGHDRAGPGQFVEADDRGQCGALTN